MPLIAHPQFFYLGLIVFAISILVTVNLDRKCFERIEYCVLKNLEHRLDDDWLQANTYRDYSKALSVISLVAVLYGFVG
jgi:hypothetical protein